MIESMSDGLLQFLLTVTGFWYTQCLEMAAGNGNKGRRPKEGFDT